MPADDLDLDELEIRAGLLREIGIAEIVRDMELNDPRDRWRHIGQLPPITGVAPSVAPTYRTPQSTVDAFWFVAGLNDPLHLSQWLAHHPRDVETLKKLWEAKHARA